jgi:DNA excision repair protein ERCC-2
MRAGDLESGIFVPDRATAAISLHQTIQQSRSQGYESEVTISHCMQMGAWAIHLSGRIDGIIRKEGRIELEEIKTTTRKPEPDKIGENPHHWAQLKLYAYMVAQEYQLETVDTCLTYAQLHTRKTHEIRQSFTHQTLEAFFMKLVTRLVDRMETIQQFQAMRNQSIGTLQFPFADIRRGQSQMMEEVYQAIMDKAQLLVQAPTGIGKTMAAILPALKTLARGKYDRMFYLTARSTGKQVAEEAFDILNTQKLRLKVVTLTAKEKICFKIEAECTRDDCKYARGFYDRVDEALAHAYDTDQWKREFIEQVAHRYQICPFEFSLELAELADCIICDYNYVFDPQAHLRRFFMRLRETYIFLVDEAHNLVDRSRGMYSAETHKKSFLALRRLVKDALPDIYRILGKVNAQFLKIMKSNQDQGKAFAIDDLPDNLQTNLLDFIKTCEKWLALNREAPFREALIECYFQVVRFMKVAELFDASYAVCCEQIQKDFRIKLFCIDPSGPLSKVLDRGCATIFFSATLTPIEYFQKMFGCGEASSDLVLTTPFPSENLCLLVSAVSTFFRNRRNTRRRVANLICKVVSQKNGNYLIFFPSYAYMTMVLESFQQQCPQIHTLVQRPGLSEIEREKFLQRFQRQGQSSLVGFAVMGGVFGEGIDLVGDRLTGAVIVGVGMPPPNLERELINAYFAEQYEAGYEFAYIFPGFNKVLQAAGRVIRSENDRGVVLLIDSRFASPRYQDLYPLDWNPNPVREPSDVVDILQPFWL